MQQACCVQFIAWVCIRPNGFSLHSRKVQWLHPKAATCLAALFSERPLVFGLHNRELGLTLAYGSNTVIGNVLFSTRMCMKGDVVRLISVYLYLKLLCTYAFPQCVLRDSYPVGLPLCAEDCVAVRQLFCYNDWALIEDNKHRGIYFKSRGHFQLPNCETLPGFRGSTQSICSNARLTEMKVDEVTYDCVIGRGRFYQGTVNVTKYGLPCQYWDSQEPHSHYRPPDVFPEMKNAENYCRNAGGEEPSPWCYTLDPAVRWQRCDIPICATTPLTLQVHIHVHIHYSTKGQFHSQVSTPQVRRYTKYKTTST
uniref:(California timema) hypothetical protein n=1 Tax=Timema californicum TaxID=61474 RepID=A0A7R9IY85_TIMCA|nr:unnamed protein product [Timema californicum]